MPDLPALDLLLVNPGAAVSTPAVFGALGRPDHPPLPPLPRDGASEPLFSWLRQTRNDLEGAARSLVPAIADVVAELDRAGARFARMSGSGATCFGIFADAAARDAAAERISRHRPDWFVLPTRTLASEPQHAAA